MKNITKLILSGCISLMLICTAGCTAFLATVGTIGVGTDTMRLERNVEFTPAWNATIETLQDMEFTIETTDMDHGLIEAVKGPSKIKIQFYYGESQTTAIDVSVRKKGLPHLKLASDIIDNINEKLRKKVK